jgi:hypothetical protein
MQFGATLSLVARLATGTSVNVAEPQGMQNRMNVLEVSGQFQGEACYNYAISVVGSTNRFEIFAWICEMHQVKVAGRDRMSPALRLRLLSSIIWNLIIPNDMRDSESSVCGIKFVRK